jgi:DNA-binding winged helix-turn-helix (wHTH) protein
MPERRHDFRLGEWLVQPDQNRVSRGHDSAQLEPKMMDVLVFLASRAQQVVSKAEITDAVWVEKFISESAVTRAIAGLRRALGDDAQHPRYIETISKRGYRLMPEVARSAAPAAPEPSAHPADVGTPARPYAVGQWVRGAHFYGRTTQLAEILDGPRDGLWIMSTRAIGKTSLLRHLEHLAGASPERRLVPLYWDLQGAATVAELHSLFHDALLDAEPHLTGHGIDVGAIAHSDLFTTLGRLRRALSSRSLKLLLLADEVEELIHLHAADPSLLRKLRRALQSTSDIRAVLASSPRLWTLSAQRDHTSPFLHGFTPPVYLPPLTDDEAEALLRQRQHEPPLAVDQATVTAVRDVCGNHPYLLQLVGSLAAELGDVEAAFERAAVDQTVAFFFAVDLELLSDTERAIVRVLAGRDRAGETTLGRTGEVDGAVLAASLYNLTGLGLVRRDDDGRYRLSNRLFREWLVRTTV